MTWRELYDWLQKNPPWNYDSEVRIHTEDYPGTTSVDRLQYDNFGLLIVPKVPVFIGDIED